MTANFLRSLRNQADSPSLSKLFKALAMFRRNKCLHFTWKYASDGLLYRVAGLLLNPAKLWPLVMIYSVL